MVPRLSGQKYSGSFGDLRPPLWNAATPVGPLLPPEQISVQRHLARRGKCRLDNDPEGVVGGDEDEYARVWR